MSNLLNENTSRAPGSQTIQKLGSRTLGGDLARCSDYRRGLRL